MRWLVTSAGNLIEVDFTLEEELALLSGRPISSRGGNRWKLQQDDTALRERLAAVDGELAEIRARNYPKGEL
jgi:hypothetical protein